VGGRYVLCRIPKVLGQFGFPSWDPATGEQNSAERIWGSFYEGCMTKPTPGGTGYEQSVVGRRLFYKIYKHAVKSARARLREKEVRRTGIPRAERRPAVQAKRIGKKVLASN
jgi:hypothetical protein